MKTSSRTFWSIVSASLIAIFCGVAIVAPTLPAQAETPAIEPAAVRRAYTETVVDYFDIASAYGSTVSMSPTGR